MTDAQKIWPGIGTFGNALHVKKQLKDANLAIDLDSVLSVNRVGCPVMMVTSVLSKLLIAI